MRQKLFIVIFLGSLWLSLTYAQSYSQQAPESPETGESQDKSSVDPAKPHPGKELLQSRCSICHAAPLPTSYTLYEWPTIIKKMTQEASLRESEAKLLYDYIESELLSEEAPDASEADEDKQ